MADRPSIIGSITRSFFISIFTVLGIFVGVFILAMIFGGVVMSGKKELNVSGHYKVLPNADGEKEALMHNTPLVLHIDVKGVIGLEDLNTEVIRNQLDRSQYGSLKGRVKALFLSVNTPGGSVFDSNSIYRLIKEYRERYDIPVHAYVDGLCASGGMYIACAADNVVATDVSLIGSVGVIANFMNVSGTLEKIGAESVTLSEGLGKDAMNPLRPWKKGEDVQMKMIIGYYYDQFVDLVLAARPRMTRDALVNKYGANIFPAPQAESYGYIDGVSTGRDSALQELVEKADIADDYQVVQLESKSWLQQLVQGRAALPKITHELKLPQQRESEESYLYLY